MSEVNKPKYQPRLVEYEGIMYEPDAPVLIHKDDNREVWTTAKQARGYWQRTKTKGDKQ